MARDCFVAPLDWCVAGTSMWAQWSNGQFITRRTITIIRQQHSAVTHETSKQHTCQGTNIDLWISTAIGRSRCEIVQGQFSRSAIGRRSGCAGVGAPRGARVGSAPKNAAFVGMPLSRDAGLTRIPPSYGGSRNRATRPRRSTFNLPNQVEIFVLASRKRSSSHSHCHRITLNHSLLLTHKKPRTNLLYRVFLNIYDKLQKLITPQQNIIHKNCSKLKKKKIALNSILYFFFNIGNK